MRIFLFPLVIISIFFFLGCDLLEDNKPDPEVPGKIVFSKFEKNDDDIQIFKMNTDGSGLQKLTNFNNHGAFEPSWSPDGSKIVFAASKKSFVGYPAIYVMNADGSNKKPLKIIQKNPDIGIGGGNPVWSPDGSKIAFESCFNCGGAGGRNFEIFIYEFSTDSVIRLTNNYWKDRHPAWSPDGTKIAFSTETAFVDSGLSGFQQDIYTIDLQSRSLTRITETGNATNPNWSPNGRYISYNTIINEGKTYLYNTETNEHKLLLPEYKISAGLEWSKKGSKIAIQVALDGRVTQRTHYYNIQDEHLELLYVQPHPFKQVKGSYKWYYDEEE